MIKKGKMDYIDLSYVSPYAFVLDPARAALEIYGREGKLDKSQIERIGSGSLTWIDYVCRTIWRGVFDLRKT